MLVDSHLFNPVLRTDPLSRCAALTLPKDSIAVLPFYQTQAELDVMDPESQTRCVECSELRLSLSALR